MTFVLFHIFLHTEKQVWHSPGILFSLSFDPQEMSLNIDIIMILHVKFSGVSSNVNNKLLTSSLSCNVLYLGKYSARIPVAHRRFCQSFCNFEEDFNHPNLCSHVSFDWWFSRILPRQNTESEKT